MNNEELMTLKLLKEKMASKGIKCPICGSHSSFIFSDSVFPIVKPSSDEDGSYHFIPGLNSMVLNTTPVICKECGHIMFFSLDMTIKETIQ